MHFYIIWKIIRNPNIYNETYYLKLRAAFNCRALTNGIWGKQAMKFWVLFLFWLFSVVIFRSAHRSVTFRCYCMKLTARIKPVTTSWNVEVEHLKERSLVCIKYKIDFCGLLKGESLTAPIPAITIIVRTQKKQTHISVLLGSI